MKFKCRNNWCCSSISTPLGNFWAGQGGCTLFIYISEMIVYIFSDLGVEEYFYYFIMLYLIISMSWKKKIDPYKFKKYIYIFFRKF